MTEIRIGAIYGRDFYGRATYGPRPLNDLVIDPFVVTVTAFDTVTLDWQEPGGSWDGFRILRSPAGFPMDEQDGLLVLDYPVGYVGPTGGHAVDSDLPGGWLYYSVFLHDSDVAEWIRVATADVLVPFDYDSTDFIWNLVPEYYKEITDTGAGYSQVKYRINPAIYRDNDDVVVNQQLVEYLNIFGWGLDFLRTETDTVLDGYDPYAVHYNRLKILAAQFGAELETSAPASANRSLVHNLGTLYRMRGTLNGIRELLSLVSGWDCEVSLGPNLMLSDDQASFAHPDPQLWDYTIRYVPGDRVKYGLYLFEAIQVAYGPTQGPPITNTNNAYWNQDRFVEPLEDRSTSRADTGDISTWQVLNTVTGLVVPNGTAIGSGATTTDDNTIHWANVLAFWNRAATSSDFVIRSVPRLLSNLTQWDKKLVIESGIPVPRATRQFVSGKTYTAGSRVLFLGSPYEAKGTTTAFPSDENDWLRLGYDDRVRMCLSFYTHATDTGPPHASGKICQPYVAEFDENGDFIQETVMTPTSWANLFYDPFSVAGDLTTGRVPVLGSAWAGGSGTWTRGDSDVGGYVYPSAGRTYQVTPATLATAVSLGATYRSIGSRSLGLIFRYSDPSNFWFASQSGLNKLVAGVVTNPSSGALTWPAFLPGDRMTVTLVGNNITVFKNGLSVGTATDSFNSTFSQHGVEAEA